MDIAERQRWFLTAIGNPEGLQAGLYSAQHFYGAACEQMIRGAGDPATRQRLGIYANSYRLRLVQCLEVEYPTLHELMGKDVFRLFAGLFIADNPSHSTTLYDLGAGFADYLERTQPDTLSAEARRLPVDIARLERARAVAGRAPGFERSTDDDAAGTRLNPSLQLVHTRHSLWNYLPDSAGAPVPCDGGYVIAVYRAHYQIRQIYLNDGQYALVQAMRRGGEAADATLTSADGAARFWVTDQSIAR